jgi:hypothetical protein
MGESAGPLRLAIGVFDEPERLEGAITDLFADNFTARDMCLVGTRRAFDTLIPAPASPAAPDPRTLLSRQLQPILPLVQDQELVATSGELLGMLLIGGKWNLGASTLSTSGLLPELLGKSTGEIGEGAIALLVSAPDPLRQHRSSRILLRHSAHTVQTHEFTPR